MNKVLALGFVLSIVSMQIASAFESQFDKPMHGGYPGVVRWERPTAPEPTTQTRERRFKRRLPQIFAGLFGRKGGSSQAKTDSASRTKGIDPASQEETHRVASDAKRLEATPISPVHQFEALESGRVTPLFAELGPMYEVDDLFWSGLAPRRMNHRDAVAHCLSLGGGARLPTKEDWISLSRAMGSGQPDQIAPEFNVDGYNDRLIPQFGGRLFWSASVHPLNDDFNAFFFFDSGNGSIHYDLSHYFRDFTASVCCVVGE
jgi:hypothetical protein